MGLDNDTITHIPWVNMRGAWDAAMLQEPCDKVEAYASPSAMELATYDYMWLVTGSLSHQLEGVPRYSRHTAGVQTIAFSL